MKAFLISAAAIVLGLSSALAENIITEKTDSKIIFNNGYLSATLDVSGGVWISSLHGDFLGQSNFSDNLLSSAGFRLERENADGTVTSASGIGSGASVTLLQDDESCGTVRINGVVDDLTLPAVTEDWEISLCKDSRYMTIKASGSMTPGGALLKARNVRHSMYSTPISTTGFFDDGVVQILNADDEISRFPSVSRLSRSYFMGGSGAIDVQRPLATGGEEDQVVLLNAHSNSSLGFSSGLQEILAGSLATRDEWCVGSTENDIGRLGRKNPTWTKEWQLTPNDRKFPSSKLPVGASKNMDDADDIESLMTGIYGSAVPCLCTYPGEVRKGFQVGQIATTLRNNRVRGYDGTYNYFDPDNFFGLSSMLDSGDAYLQEQVRFVVERTGSYMNVETGQLPHHFDGLQPYYLALSGETQTGPNTFWTKTAISYAAAAGNTEWLRNYMPTLRKAASFVFDLIDPQINLVFAPGSLMIDVFIRNNYTSDTNAMVVGFLREFAAAERLLGNETRAVELEDTARKVAEAVNAKLWAGEDAGGDHFITQLNVDGTTRDFVDYDANLIAVAHAIPDESRSRSIQKRVDSGRCSAASGAGPQFVSEIYYGPDDTTNGNTGDSWCSMARIGWFDALGRKRLGADEDLKYFNDRILTPVQHDVIANTWMHERYGCDGLQQENRTMYYFEYPSFAAMLVREIRYGLSFGLDAIRIEPFGAPGAYEMHLADIDVVYAAEKTLISVPGSGLFPYVITGMQASAEYSVEASTGCNVEGWINSVVIAGEDGVLSFTAPRGTASSGCVVTVSLQA